MSTITALRPKKTVKGVAPYPAIDVTGLKGKKLVAPTFDDGPSQYTGKLLAARYGTVEPCKVYFHG